MANSLEFTDQVLICRVGQFREADYWVRFFSSSRGILTGFAFGGAKSRCRFQGCLDFLNHVLLKVDYKAQGRYLCLQEGTLLHRFSGLQQDVSRLGMAVNCLKFLEAAHVGTGNASDVFELFLKTLLLLDQAPEVSSSLPLLFRTRLAAIYGYQANLSRCALCGRDLFSIARANFAIPQGNAFCSACVSQQTPGQQINAKELELLQKAFFVAPKDWFQIFCGAPKRVFYLLDRFVQFHTGLTWRNGRFVQV
ncbi:MAG: DNA repair protein RecO [Desulfohalobiaceae bacterium]